MECSHKSILVVSPDIPYPPNHGGRVDIWNRIKLLKSFGFKVDLIATGKIEPDPDELKVIEDTVDNFIFCPRKNRIIDMFRFLPLQVCSRKLLKTIRLSSTYNATILESEYVYTILENNTLNTDTIIVRIHNDEARYFRELCSSAKFGLAKLYYYLESFKFMRLATILSKQLQNFMFISQDEFRAFKNKYPGKHSICIPYITTVAEPKPISLDSMNVLFIGSFFMINNKEGILWYLENVHSLLNDIAEYRLILAGNSKGQDISWIYDASARFDNIVIHDSPEDLDAIYDQGAVFINPMLHGAGVKLKTIEAIQYSLPVVSTTIGNQGTGLSPDKDILVANEPGSYASCVRKLLCDKEYAKNIVVTGQKTLMNDINRPTILKDYIDSLWRD